MMIPPANRRWRLHLNIPVFCVPPFGRGVLPSFVYVSEGSMVGASRLRSEGRSDELGWGAPNSVKVCQP